MDSPMKPMPEAKWPEAVEAKIGWHISRLEWVRVTEANETECENIQILPAVLLSEHTHLLSEAVANAKAEAFEEAASLAAAKFMGFHTPYEYTENLENVLKEKATELRENGEKK